MPKRKRGAEDGSPSKQDVRQKRVEEKLFHSKKILQRALKVAKGFERQKLGRRQKTGVQQKNDTDKKRIDDEIEALKNIDLPSFAESHLYKTLLKQKDVAASTNLPASVGEYKHPQRDTATMNVSARLYNSNPVKQAMSDALPIIRDALGLGVESKISKGAAGKSLTSQRDEARERHESMGVSGDEDSLSDANNEGLVTASLEPRRRSPTTAQNTFDEEDDFTDFDARVAGSSDEDDIESLDRPPSEEGTFDGEDLALEERSDHEGTGSDLMSGSASSSGLKSETASPSPKQPSSRRVESNPHERAGTNFLPSLTMGGYVSNSDSEAESDVERLGARKNRRGQRARQAIWEKKFGAGAKHVQQERAQQGRFGQSGKRDEGWDPKRGAQTNGERSKGGGYKPRWQQDRSARKAQGGDTASGGNALALGSKRMKEQAGGNAVKALHPSWEAAKKAKEQKQQQQASFVGKKMVFD